MQCKITKNIIIKVLKNTTMTIPIFDAKNNKPMPNSSKIGNIGKNKTNIAEK